VRVIHAIKRVAQYWWTKLNAVLFVNLCSSVTKSYTSKLRHMQFGAAYCRLPAAPRFYLFWGLLLRTVDFVNECRYQM